MDVRQLQFRLKYISPTGETTTITTFQRALAVCSALFEPGQHKPPFTTLFSGGHFILSNRVDPPVRLPVQKFCEAASLSIVDLKSRIEAALPPGVRVYEIPVHRLRDDFSSVAIHHQAQNTPLLEPLISEYWQKILEGPSDGYGKSLFDKRGITRVEADKWLEIYDSCFPSAAAVMTLNSGGLNPASFKRYCYHGTDRNIFLLRNGLLSFVNPLASHRVTDRHLDIVTMPLEATHLFLVLITILLPIANKLRMLKGQILPLQSTHLWVLPRRHTTGNFKWLYNSNDANERLMELTTPLFSLTLDGELIRKMVYQVFVSEFPLLFCNTMRLRSPVDDLAQHHWITGVYNYGRLNHFPPNSVLVSDRAARNVVSSEIWHALTRTGPTQESWRLMVQGTALFPATTFPEDAFQVARRLVLTHYKFQEASRAGRAQLVQHLLSTKPFLQGITVGLSDRSLVVIMADNFLTH